MTKDKKNNKLIQMLAKHHQRQADIYFGMAGMDENSDNGSQKKSKLWLFGILLIVALGIGVVVASGLGKKGGQNSSTETIYVPDFAVFSNGYAKLENPETKYEDYVGAKYQVERGIDEIMQEYHELLSEKYSYRLVQNTAMRDENNQIISEYYYVYMGEENVSKFTVETGEESFAIQLMIVATITEEGSGVVEIKGVHEIQKQDNQEKTSYVPDVLFTPDFIAFTNGYGVSLGTVNQEDHVMTTYEFDADAVEFIVDEYRSVLEAGYPYQLVGEKEQESNDGWISKEYYYRYTGDEPIPAFVVKTDDGDADIQLGITVLTKEGSEDGVVYLSSLNETIWQENGEKTTYVPLKITGVILDCYDLFYGKDGTTQQNWIPEGYTMGYNFSVTYTGTKTKSFVGNVRSSDETVLKKVEGKSEFIALAPGTVTITAVMEDWSVEKEITVYAVDRSYESWLKLSQDKLEINSEDVHSLDIEAVLGFGNVNSSVNIIARVYGTDISYKVEPWSEVKDKTCTRKYTFEIEPDKFNKKSKKGIIFYLVKCDAEGNYELSQDILDYKIVEFVWNIKE